MAGLNSTLAGLKRLRPTPAPSPTGGPPKLIETADFGADPGELRMLSYRPPGLAKGAPLVVVLHGCGQTAEGYALGVGWLGLADRYGFSVLCPEQRQHNNPNRCFNWFQPGDAARGGGEAASIRAMVSRALADHHADPSRVFVTGLSAGGAMASIMLAAYPDVFAAGAIVAGLPYGAASNVQEAFGAMMQGAHREPADWGDRVRGASDHAGPWPRVAIWHGDSDVTVQPVNGQAVADQWTNVHALATAPIETTTALGHRRQVWNGADGAPVVELYRLRGMGHGAPLATSGPDGVGAAGPFLIEMGVSSSLEIARFWGIAPVGVAAAPGAVAAGAVAAERLDFRPVPQAKPAFDPGAVINKALRAAGLMK